MSNRIEIETKPDSIGRVRYVRFWHVEHPAYCLTCGTAQERGCACYGLKKTRAQYFFAVPPTEGEHVSRYSNDPREIRTKYAGKCKKCGRTLRPGERAAYWPLTKTMYCWECGEADLRKCLAECAAEDCGVSL